MTETAEVMHATSPVRIRNISTQVRRSEWAALAAADPDTMVTQRVEWMQALLAGGRFVDATRAYELSDGRRFVLPMVRRAGPLGRAAMAGSFPAAWGFGGLVGPGLDADAARPVLTDAMNSAARVRIQPNPRHCAIYAAAMPEGVVARPRRDHVVRLPADVDTMWNGVLSGKTRRSVSKAEREGVVVRRGSAVDLPVVQSLFHASVDRWALKQHEPAWLAHVRAERRDPLAKWDAIARQLGERFGLWLATVDGEPAGAIIVLYGPNAHYARSVMRKDLAGPTRCNYLLLWRAVAEAIERGCRDLHMGESGWNAGLSSFKEQFGAEAVEHHDYVLERLPVGKVDTALRSAAKRVLRFED